MLRCRCFLRSVKTSSDVSEIICQGNEFWFFHHLVITSNSTASKSRYELFYFHWKLLRYSIATSLTSMSVSVTTSIQTFYLVLESSKGKNEYGCFIYKTFSHRVLRVIVAALLSSPNGFCCIRQSTMDFIGLKKNFLTIIIHRILL